MPHLTERKHSVRSESSLKGPGGWVRIAVTCGDAPRLGGLLRFCTNLRLGGLLRNAGARR